MCGGDGGNKRMDEGGTVDWIELEISRVRRTLHDKSYYMIKETLFVLLVVSKEMFKNQ